MHTQTEGNPLFVTEVVRLLAQEGDLGAEQVWETDSWALRIPEGVREVIGRRLNRLSQRRNEALTVASIVGREFTLDQLKPIVEDVPEDRLFEVLEEALDARVIEELAQSVGRYQFTHALIQETLAQEQGADLPTHNPVEVDVQERQHREQVASLPRDKTTALAWHYEAPVEGELSLSPEARKIMAGFGMDEAALRGFAGHVAPFVTTVEV